jgi:hypothetical protein
MPPPRIFLPAAQNGIYRKNDTQLLTPVEFLNRYTGNSTFEVSP